MNYLYKLPEELIRLIYEYDDTYSIMYKKCVNELIFLRKSYPVQFTHVFFHIDSVVVTKLISLSKLPDYRKFIYDYCNRKKTLRSYKNTSCKSLNMK